MTTHGDNTEIQASCTIPLATRIPAVQQEEGRTAVTMTSFTLISVSSTSIMALRNSVCFSMGKGFAQGPNSCPPTRPPTLAQLFGRLIICAIKSAASTHTTSGKVPFPYCTATGTKAGCIVTYFASSSLRIARRPHGNCKGLIRGHIGNGGYRCINISYFIFFTL
jgi:hypothetical protein